MAATSTPCVRVRPAVMAKSSAGASNSDTVFAYSVSTANSQQIQMSNEINNLEDEFVNL
jgi:hypothetical protein